MHKHRRLALATPTTAALTGGPLAFAAASPATAAGSVKVAKADFNGDVTTSAPGAYVSGQKDAGQIAVLYRTATAGVSTSGTPRFGAVFTD
ncbi:hypothetical protein [Streptomyces sp. NPDC002599]|uniref:hypothetical protein n=1 Tax=Streptomyces sp. NPDC002599 TaxID=3154421 RepID=UPI0033323A2E